MIPEEANGDSAELTEEQKEYLRIQQAGALTEWKAMEILDQAIHRAGYPARPGRIPAPYYFYRSNRMSDQAPITKDGTVQNSIVSVNATIDSLFGAISSLEKRIEPVTISNIPNPESGETQVDSEVRVVQEIDSIDSRVREAVRQLLRLEERVKL